MVKNMVDEIGYYNGRMFDREDLEIIQKILMLREKEFPNYKVQNILSLIERYLNTGM
jgi:DNA-binding transcriptional MerR regulator